MVVRFSILLALLVGGLAGCTSKVQVQNKRTAVTAAEKALADEGGAPATDPATQDEVVGEEGSVVAAEAAAAEAVANLGLFVDAATEEPECKSTLRGRLMVREAGDGGAVLKSCVMDSGRYRWVELTAAGLGAQSAQGPQGDTGEAGEPGDTGPQGPVGEKGATGAQGATGSVGPTGPQGPVGPTGAAGVAGSAGAAGTDKHDRMRAQVRLSLDNAAAVTSTDQTAKTTIYLVPYSDGTLALYSGGQWVIRTTSGTSVAVPATTSTNFDVFAYDNSGTVTLETVNWTDATTRATALTTQDGILVKSGDATRRYLGTGRTTSVSGQTEDSASKRFLWNAQNRVPRKMRLHATTNYTRWSPPAYFSCGSNSANRVEGVFGLDNNMVELYTSGAVVSSYTSWQIGIGLDRNTGFDSQRPAIIRQDVRSYGFYRSAVTAGYHYFQCVEYPDSNDGIDVDDVGIIGFMAG